MRILTMVAFGCSVAFAAPVEIRSGCEDTDSVIERAPATARIQVHLAIAGGMPCYSVTATVGDRVLNGYVLDTSLPAVVRFETERQEAFRRATAARPVTAPAAAPAEATPPPPASRFPDFATRDLSGKPVSLSSLRGKVVIVTFWSPSHPKTLAGVTALRGLYTEFHAAGLDALGVAVTASDNAARTALDDKELDWPQITDRAGLSRAMNVGANEPKTFVLDANRNVVAAGLEGPELGALVRKMLQK